MNALVMLTHEGGKKMEEHGPLEQMQTDIDDRASL